MEASPIWGVQDEFCKQSLQMLMLAVFADIPPRLSQIAITLVTFPQSLLQVIPIPYLALVAFAVTSIVVETTLS